MTSNANGAYTMLTGITCLKQGITLKGTLIPDEDKLPKSSAQLNHSVTVMECDLMARDSQLGPDQSCAFTEVKDHHQHSSQS